MFSKKERKKEKGKSSIDFIPTRRIACRQQAEIEVILLLLFSTLNSSS